MNYGEEIVVNFDVEKDLEIWPNKSELNYTIKITLPEFVCLCPRSGYPDFANIYVEYIPNDWVVELKAIKLYINSFMKRQISHEDSINEIYSVLHGKLKPKYLSIIGNFNPRGNVHTIVEINSNTAEKKAEKPVELQERDYSERRSYRSTVRSDRGGERRSSRFSDRKPYERKSSDRKSYDKKGSDEKSYDRKPYERKSSDKKSYDRKPYERKSSDKDSYDRKPAPKKEPFFKSDKLKSQKPKVVKK